MKVQQILDTKGSMDVFSIAATATIRELVHHLCERKCGALLIKDDAGALAGIISERDVIRQLDAGANLDELTVGEVMTRNLVSVRPEEDIHSAMDLMVSARIRHLPVVSDGKPCGLVTVRDLIHSMREADQNDVAKLVEYLRSQVEES